MTSETPEETQPPAPPLPPPPPPPTYRAPAPAPPPPRRGSSAWKWGCGIVIGGCMLLVVVLLLIVIAALAGSTRRGGRMAAGAPIALIRIDGAIVAGRGGSSFLGGGATGSEAVVDQIEQAMADKAVRAVLLRVNSPGGSAAGSQEIYRAISRAREDGLTVVVSMADVAASGGYYVSANADKIYANPATMTGSIGVISMHENLSGLFDKIGIQTETIKSGKLKDMGSPMGPLGDEARNVIREIVMQVYDQFVAAVAEGRQMKPEAVRKLADGRIYSGAQAKQSGLVDELGGLQEALQGAADLAGIKGKPEYKEYGPTSFLERLLQAEVLGRDRKSTVTVTGGVLYDSYAAQLLPGPWPSQARPGEQ